MASDPRDWELMAQHLTRVACPHHGAGSESRWPKSACTECLSQALAAEHDSGIRAGAPWMREQAARVVDFKFPEKCECGPMVYCDLCEPPADAESRQELAARIRSLPLGGDADE